MSEEVPSWVWVGLSNCDEYRERRTRFAREILEKLENYQVMMVDGGQLFHEACNCYQNGAFMATAIMCRASLEAAVYTLATRVPVVKGPMMRAQLDLALVQDEAGNILDYGRIVQAVKQKGLLDGEMEQRINRIRERGNFAVHLGQKLDASTFEWQQGKTARPGNRWIFESEVRGILEDTVELLNSMISKHME